MNGFQILECSHPCPIDREPKHETARGCALPARRRGKAPPEPFICKLRLEAEGGLFPGYVVPHKLGPTHLPAMFWHQHLLSEKKNLSMSSNADPIQFENPQMPADTATLVTSEGSFSDVSRLLQDSSSPSYDL